MTDDRAPLPFARPLPPAFRHRTVRIEAGGSRPFDPAEWADTIVGVHGGTLELECHDGTRRRFDAGAILWLTGLPLRALHNPGPEPVVLVTVSRAMP